MENSELDQKIIDRKGTIIDRVVSSYLMSQLGVTKIDLLAAIHRLQMKGYPIVEYRNGMYAWVESIADLKKYARRYAEKKKEFEEKLAGITIAYQLKVGIKKNPLSITATVPYETNDTVVKYIDLELDEHALPIMPEGGIDNFKRFI